MSNGNEHSKPVDLNLQ